jgi:hypothetical protein
MYKKISSLRSKLSRSVRAEALLYLFLSLGFAASAPPVLAAAGEPVITNQPVSQVILIGNSVTFSVGATGNTPLFYQWWRNSTLISTATNSSYVIASTAQTDNNAVFYVTVSNALGRATSSNATLVIDPGILTTNSFLLLPFNANWRYNQSGQNLGTAWKEIVYNDTVAGWGNGPGVFDAKTTPRTIIGGLTVGTQLSLDFASGQRATNYYFRTHFNFTNANVVSVSLFGTNIFDDGFALYLNGAEGYRTNVPAGATAATWANGTIGDGAQAYMIFPATNLVQGDNVLAAEVHQVNNTSSDITWGLALYAAVVTRIGDTNFPSLVRVTPTPGTNLRYLTEIEVLFSKPVTGVDASDLLINGVPATNLTYGLPGQFLFDFAQPATGLVQVAWKPNHGITDLSAPPNPFAGGSWTYNLDTNVVLAKVMINEFLASNGGKTYRDEDGDSSDWIELYSTETVAVNLNGWFLTDDPAQLTKWRFPAYAMQPGEYLVVFASGKNRTNLLTGRLHTNFQLNKGGGFLALVDQYTNIVSAFQAYPTQTKDVSYGRDRTFPSLVGFFTTPTPGGPNSTTGAGFAPAVLSSRPSGTFPLNAPFQLTLRPDAVNPTNVTIYYSFGTSTPDTNATRYTGPIQITSTTIVRARAFTPGLFPGPLVTLSYIALDPQANILAFDSDLPLMILHNFGAGALDVNSKTPQYVLVQTFEPVAGHCSLTNTAVLAEHGTFHIRGSSTAGNPKGSFALETHDEFEDNKNVPLLGLPDENDWVLYAPNNFEPVLMHNPLAHQLYRDTGHYTSRTRFVEVFLKDDLGVPGPITYGDYNGIYVLEEKIKIDQNRVAIDKMVPENKTPPSVTGGYLLSVDRGNGEPGLNAGNLSMNYLDPSGTDMATASWAAQATYIQNYFNSFYAALSGSDWTNPVTGYAAWVDVNQWINFHIHEVVTFNVDGFRLSGYLFKPRNDKIMMGPCWDYDRTQGSTDSRDFNPYRWRSNIPDYGTDFFNPGSTFSNPWYGKMFNDPDFWQKWIDMYQQQRDTIWSSSNIFAHIDDFANQVRHAQPRDLARWGVAPRSGTVSVDGFNYTFSGGFDGEVKWTKDWYTNRLYFIDTNFLDRASFSAKGGLVPSGFSLTLIPAAEPGSSIYYTLNGTDPRLPGGGISPQAFSSSGPALLSINSNVRVFARSRNPNHANLTGANNPPINSLWSGPRVDSFYVSIPTLRITEIMYHPQPLPGNTNDANNFEYLELTNVGSNTLSLIGFQFTNGITFTFTATNRVTSLAPGGRVLLVKSLAAFALRYPTVTNLVAGEYSGSLDNAGEELALIGPMGEPILDFSYDPNWYPLADGEGFSLVAVNENAPPSAWTNAVQWRMSAYDGGSPGAADSALVPVLPVLVNELLSLPVPPACDAVELFNPNGSPADIGGWYLTDNYDVPKRYRIPDGTFIPAYGFMLFYETNSFGAPGLPDAFGFSSKGEDVYLFSGDSLGRLTGYAHGFSFGAAEDMRNFGRYVTSDGQEHFELQAANTLGTTNGLPRVGPVVINELMYHPPDVGGIDNTLDEYIELLNITASPVPLFDPAAPTNTWQVKGGVDFIFPTNVTLPAGQYLLLVNFDPGDTNLLASFVAKYAVPGGVLIFGPYGGKLNNGGDSVEVKRPTLQLGVDPAWVLLEKVQYSDGAPWPCGTSGSGVSLQRQQAGAFGNDPLNWAGLNPTAGRANIMVAPGAPVIVSPPVDRVAVAGGNTTFSVGVCGPPPYTYRWQFNGSTIGNASNATYTINPVRDTDEGPYRVIVANASGSVTSPPAMLYVAKAPIIVQPPQNVLVPLFGPAAFSVIATGTPPLQYQWRCNGIFLPGQTNSALSFASVQITNAGRYSVVVGNPYGNTISAEASLSVDAPLTIVEQPQSVTIGPVSTNWTTNTAALSVTAVGRGPLNYQWLFWGTNLPGATSATLTISNVALSNAGPYAVLVSDTNQTRLSSNVMVALLVRPYILVPISAQSVVYGGTATLSVWAGPLDPTLPLTYRWLKGGAYLVTNDQPTLVLSNLTATTSCQVVVVNAAGTAFKPQVALTVLPDTDRDGLPDAMELAMGYPTNNAADGTWDYDGDGMSNAAEAAAGTDPTNKLSVLKLIFPMTNAVANGQVQFYFTAMSNKTYSVEYRDVFGRAGWSNLVSLDSLLTNRVVWVTNQIPPAVVNRYYRVKTPRNF